MGEAFFPAKWSRKTPDPFGWPRSPLRVQTARQSCSGAFDAPLRVRLRAEVCVAASVAWRRMPRHAGIGVPAGAVDAAVACAPFVAFSCNRRAAGVATGTWPVAPPATVRRTAARSA
jgi:hypothetical protein